LKFLRTLYVKHKSRYEALKVHSLHFGTGTQHPESCLVLTVNVFLTSFELQAVVELEAVAEQKVVAVYSSSPFKTNGGVPFLRSNSGDF
jgi:hypothetical protein